MRNNFEVVQCTLLNKLISLSLPYFQNVGQVVIMEWMWFWNMGKEEGEAAGRHCHSSSFISMPFVCYLYLCFFLSQFCLLGCSFPSSSPLKVATLVRMECRITCLFVCWRSYVQRRSFLRSFLHWQGEIFKGHCSRSAPLSYGDKKKRQEKKTVLQLNGFTRDSLKEIEEKVTYTHTEGKK